MHNGVASEDESDAGAGCDSSVGCEFSVDYRLEVGSSFRWAGAYSSDSSIVSYVMGDCDCF